MKYVKPKKVYEQEMRDYAFLTENLNEGRSMPTRGNYKIEWPLNHEKYAEWTPKEISDVEKLEYDDGEWGGFAINRNWTDKNPIQNYNDDFLAQSPGNLFYNKTKVGSMTITSYNVTSGDHVVAKMEVRILKVNNGKKDGYVCFYDFGIDSEYDEQEDACILLDSWSRVLKMLKSLRDKMKSNDGFHKVLDSPANKSVRFLLGESESVNEATVDLDTAEEGLKDKVFLAYLKKNKIDHEIVNPNGPGGGHPEVRFTAKSAKILKAFIDEFYMDDHLYTFIEESVNEAKAPKNWDSQFTMKAIEAYENGEFDLEDDKSIAEWDKEFNGGRAPKPAFNTKELVSYAIATGKKPDGSKLEESVNESLALSIAGGIVLGVVGAIAAVKGLKAVSNIGANVLDAAALAIRDAKDKAEDKKHFNETIVPIAKRFENDKELEKMYQELNPFMAGYSKTASAKNKERTKALNKIAKYIKSKLSKDELYYFSAVSAVLRTGEAKVGRNRFSVEESIVTEGRKRVRVKRKYGENHPETTVGRYAPVRETILRHVKENGGTVSKSSLKEFIKGMNEDSGTKTSWNWVRRNAKYIKETRFGYKLTKLGERVLKATTINESIVLNEGQFSWMTQDTGNQIGSERQNTIFVTMFDDKGNKFEEKGYDGYGEFGGKDYYELLAEMNGINKDNVDELIDKYKVRVFGKDLTSKLRQCGIELAFESNKKLAVGVANITGTTKLKFPALYEHPRDFNKNRHDFHREAESDPNQSWYTEEYDPYGDEY